MQLQFDEVNDEVTIVTVTLAMPIFAYDQVRMNMMEIHPLLTCFYLMHRYTYMDQGIYPYLDSWDHFFLARASWACWYEYVERLTDQQEPEPESPTQFEASTTIHHVQ